MTGKAVADEWQRQAVRDITLLVLVASSGGSLALELPH
jgi:hypothetical protein